MPAAQNADRRARCQFKARIEQAEREKFVEMRLRHFLARSDDFVSGRDHALDGQHFGDCLLPLRFGASAIKHEVRAQCLSCDNADNGGILFGGKGIASANFDALASVFEIIGGASDVSEVANVAGSCLFCQSFRCVTQIGKCGLRGFEQARDLLRGQGSACLRLKIGKRRFDVSDTSRCGAFGKDLIKEFVECAKCGSGSRRVGRVNRAQIAGSDLSLLRRLCAVGIDDAAGRPDFTRAVVSEAQGNFVGCEMQGDQGGKDCNRSDNKPGFGQVDWRFVCGGSVRA